jgi:hypothetical protein
MSQDQVATIFAGGNGVDAATIDGVQIVTLTRAALRGGFPIDRIARPTDFPLF